MLGCMSSWESSLSVGFFSIQDSNFASFICFMLFIVHVLEACLLVGILVHVGATNRCQFISSLAFTPTVRHT